MNDKQKKERIRYLSDKLESIYSEIEPKLKEFELTNEELNELLGEDETESTRPTE